jgi:uncharacterized protein
MNQATTTAHEGPVTVIARWRVKPGRSHDFETWIAGVTAAALEFPGHLGVNIIRPNDPAHQEYVLIFRFDTYEHLQRWEESEQRRDWLERARPLRQAEPQVQKLSGLEYWFTQPGTPTPPRYKMVIVTILAIAPLSTLISLTCGWLIGRLPILLQGLAMASLLVPLMTYLVMPLMLRLLGPWLFKPKREH